jgi:hypothetical protein
MAVRVALADDSFLVREALGGLLAATRSRGSQAADR